MRVLLDENLNWRLLRSFDEGILAFSTRQRGWDGIRNGELLELAQHEFDVLVTRDKGIAHQQNLKRYATGIIVIETMSNRLPAFQALMPQVNTAIRRIQPHQVIRIQA